LFVAILCSLGCSSNNKGKLEGTKWTSLPANIKGRQLAAGELTLDFGTDYSIVYKAGPRTFRGTYALGRGDNVTLNLDKLLAGSKERAEKITVDGDTLTMTESDGTELVFKRLRETTP
jgi:hypothetical protein